MFNLRDKINLKGRVTYAALWNLSIYYTWKNIAKLNNNKKFKIWVPTWNEELELPDGSYSVSLIQENFEYTLRKHEQKVNDNNSSIKIYVNKVEHRITFKIKTTSYLEHLMLETIVLLGSTKNKLTKDKNGGNMPHLKINEALLATIS